MSEEFGTNDGLDNKVEGDDARSSRIDQVLMAHLQERSDGVQIEAAELIDQHPELMPELEERLHLLCEIAEQRQANEGLATRRLMTRLHQEMIQLPAVG